MNRIKPGGYGELIGAAYQVVPVSLHRFIQCDFLTGTDPLFVGLHRFETASYDRSYRDTGHVAYPNHQGCILSKSQRRTTVVWPRLKGDGHGRLENMVHELGHVLHESLRFEPVVDPVTWYAQTNHHEAFAEAFAAWLFPGWYPLPPGPEALALFEDLKDR